MSWVNALERGVAWTFTDHYGGQGQLYMPTRDHGEAIGDFEARFYAVCVGQPMPRSMRIHFPGERTLPLDLTDPNQNVNVAWRVTGLNTLTGKREYLDIPCANANLIPAGTDLADLGSSPFSGLVADFNKMWRAPSTSDPGPMIVEQIRLVGVE